MCIHGNIFGDGNYSTVEGKSSITISGYDQYGDHSIWSIQRADKVLVDGSHIEIRGAADGGNLDLTQELTINRVGLLVLADSSHLVLHTETSMIGEYRSTVDGETLVTRADCLSDDPVINRISIHNGRMFSVLGMGNMGYSDVDGNGVFSGMEPEELVLDYNGNGIWDPADEYTDSNRNGKWDDAEVLTKDHDGDGVWDEAEFNDRNGNGKYDPGWPSRENGVDRNGNGVYELADEYTDSNRNGKWDAAETLTKDHNGNGIWDAADEYIDSNGNGVWDYGESYEGLIKGYSVLSRADDSHYYGAYAVGSLGSDRVTAGFMIDSGNTLIDAPVLDGDGRVNVTRMWYITGHVEIGRTWTFQQKFDGSGGEYWRVNDSLSIPRMGGSNTIFAYSGVTNNPLALNTLFIVNSSDYNAYAGTISSSNPASSVIGDRMFFRINMSGGIIANGNNMDVRSHTIIDDKWVREGYTGYNVLGGSTIQLVLNSELLSFEYYGTDDHLGISGLIGETTLSFLEMMAYTTEVNGIILTQYIPINMVDVEITLYVEPRSVSDEVQLSTIVNVSPVGGTYAGTGYIILPSIEYETEYTLEFEGAEFDSDVARVTMYSDDQYLNQLGWITARYDSNNPLVTYENGIGLSAPVSLGTGGIRPSVLRVDYIGDMVNDDVIDLHISTSSGSTTYHVQITFQEGGIVELTLMYSPVYDGGMKGLSMALDADMGQYNISWVDGQFATPIGIPYGTTIDDHEYIIFGSSDNPLTLHQMMDYSITKIERDKPANDSGSQGFDYVMYFQGWYLDSGQTRQFNPSEPVRESMTLYAGFGITIRFHGEGVNVVPQTITIEPGTSLNDNGLYNIHQAVGQGKGTKPYSGSGDERQGYYLQQFDGRLSWAYLMGDDYTEVDFTVPIYGIDGVSIIDMYLPWVAYSYNLTVGIDPSSPTNSMVNSIHESGVEIHATDSIWTVRYGNVITIGFSHNVSEVTSDHITDYTGLNTSTLTFTVPYIGDDGSSFHVDVLLITGLTFTFTYDSSGLATPIAGNEGLALTITDTYREDNTTKFRTQTLNLSNSSRTGLVTAYSNSVVSLSVETPEGFYWSAFMGDVLMTLGEGGRVVSGSEVELGSNFQTQQSVTISTYRPVGLDSRLKDSIGPDGPITGLTVIGKNLSGEDYSIAVSWDSKGVYNGKPLFEGYTISVSLYSSDRISYGVFDARGVSGNGPYTVLGTMDVLFLCNITSTWELSITFLMTNGYPINSGVLSRNMAGTMITVECDGTEYTFDILKGSDLYVDSTGTMTKVMTGGIPSEVICHLGGFRMSSGMPDDSGSDHHVIMNLIEYTVHYDGITVDQDVVWNSLLGDSLPYTDADTASDIEGNSIWVFEYGVGDKFLVDRIYLDMFDGSDSVTMIHMPALIGGIGSVVEEIDHIVILYESEVRGGVDIVLDLGADANKVVVNDIEFDYAEGSLKIRAEMIGTGLCIVFMNGYVLATYIVSDFGDVSI